MNCDGVIFDLDGTLWDATEELAASWAQALAGEPDVPRPPTKEELEKVMGMTDKQLVAVIFPQVEQAQGLALFEKCCAAENIYLRQHGGRLYEGLVPALEALAEKLPLFIVSNCNLGYIPAFLEAHKLESLFQDWECIGRTGKEKWENIRLVAGRNGLKHPVYVGDTAMDQASAKKAGVPFVHAAYGFGQAPGAPAVHSPQELPGLLLP